MLKYHKIKNMVNTRGSEWREGKMDGGDSCGGEALRDEGDGF